jgi:hypothetical protein
MRVLVTAVLVVSCLLIIPVVAYAQASITGTVKDTSGAVIPGATVEVASPVLIEKVRTAVTDGNGRYQILDLRPGDYVVTFTLTGFNAVRRDGITLSGSGTVAVDAELRVGALAETVTVTGETPIVDVQSTTKQQVLSADVIEALPSSRNYVTLARMVLGTTAAGGGGGALNDVGGSVLGDVGSNQTVHGSAATDQRITLNGVSVMTLQAGGSLGGQQPDPGSASEVTVDTSSLSADLPSGGLRINFIPRDGGNRFSNAGFVTFSNSSLQGSNYTDALKAAGLAIPNKIVRNYDISDAFGGPLKKDKLWFWFSARYDDVANEVAVLQNANAFDPSKWNYAPIQGQAGVNKGTLLQSSLRVTWQATPRNKIAGTYKVDRWCQCPNNISATVAPEAGRDRRFPRLRQEHLEWTSPVTNHLMLELVGLHLFERWGNMDLRQDGGSLASAAQEAAIQQMIGVVEQCTAGCPDNGGVAGINYRAMGAPYNNTLVPNFAYRGAVSYITGSHAFKIGFNRTHGFQQTTNYNYRPFQYRFNNGIPNQLTQYATPYVVENRLDNDFGVYAQDRWTMNRMTVGLALRFDQFASSFPEQHVGAGLLLPNRSIDFPEQDNLGWKDITYRSGFTYDVFGDGKTAIKLSANKYLLGQTLNALGTNPNPINALVTSATRTWNDRGGLGVNGDYIPQCDFLNPATNGECGPISNAAFGTTTPQDLYDKDLLTGWGHRQANWEFSAGVQREIMRRVSVDFGYFRRIWSNFPVTDNVLQSPQDFTQFSMTVPTDSRLPNGGGYTVTGLYNVVADKFSSTQNVNTLSDKFGNQIQHWNGFDIGVNARPRNGLTIQGGVSTGKSVDDNCDVVAALPEMLNTGTATAPVWRPAQNCHRESPFLTQVKLIGIYTVPKVDVQIAGTLRSAPGTDINANFAASQAYISANSTLGRALSGGATQNMTVALLAPNTRFLERRNELDMRFGKVLRAGHSRSVVSIDLFNVLNTDVPVSVNQSYGTWLTPTEILNPRLVKFSLQLDF